MMALDVQEKEQLVKVQTALDNINVRRLMAKVERAVSQAAEEFVWNPSSSIMDGVPDFLVQSGYASSATGQLWHNTGLPATFVARRGHVLILYSLQNSRDGVRYTHRTVRLSLRRAKLHYKRKIRHMAWYDLSLTPKQSIQHIQLNCVITRDGAQFTTENPSVEQSGAENAEG